MPPAFLISTSSSFEFVIFLLLLYPVLTSYLNSSFYGGDDPDVLVVNNTIVTSGIEWIM